MDSAKITVVFLLFTTSLIIF